MIYFPFDNKSETELDRNVSSDVFADYLATYFTNGVLMSPSTNLQVVQSNGMYVTVKPGVAVVNGRFAKEKDSRELQIQASQSQDRIDRVVLRLNKSARTLDLYVIKGMAATTPVPPDLVREGDLYDICLANLFISKLTTAIPDNRITDTRLDTTACGLVSFRGSKVDTTSIFLQFQSALDAYMDIVQQALDETLAGNILSKLTKDMNTLVVPSTAVWTQLTPSTASAEELENDPALTNSWYTDVLFACDSNDYIELQPNVPTGELGLAFYNRSLANAVRLYAGANLTGNELKFMVVSKRKRNGVA